MGTVFNGPNPPGMASSGMGNMGFNGPNAPGMTSSGMGGMGFNGTNAPVPANAKSYHPGESVFG